MSVLDASALLNQDLPFYRVNQNIPQHENQDTSKMLEYFVLNFAHLFRRQLCKSVPLCAVFT